MRLPASEKLEIIGLVEQSHLPARRTLIVRLQMVWDNLSCLGTEALSSRSLCTTMALSQPEATGRTILLERERGKKHGKGNVKSGNGFVSVDTKATRIHHSQRLG